MRPTLFQLHMMVYKLLWYCVLPLALENEWYIIRSCPHSVFYCCCYTFFLKVSGWLGCCIPWIGETSLAKKCRCLLILKFWPDPDEDPGLGEAFEFKWHQHPNLWLVKFLQFDEPKSWMIMFTALLFITECCAPCCLWWSRFSCERAGGHPPCQCAQEDKGVVFFGCTGLVVHMHVEIVNDLHSTQFITLCCRME